MKKKYLKEDFDTDVDWLKGMGLEEREAKQFILNLLKKEKAW